MAEENEVVKRKRGRPRKYPPKPVKQPPETYELQEGDNSRFIRNSLAVAALPEIDKHDPAQVRKRINEYFEICAEQDVRPSVVGLALAFDWHRTTLWRVANGADGMDKTYSPEVRNALRKAYNLLNLQLEDMMLSGRVNPVTGIFLGKNHFAYSDRSEFVVNNSQAEQAYNASDIADRYKLTE